MTVPTMRGFVSCTAAAAAATPIASNLRFCHRLSHPSSFILLLKLITNKSPRLDQLPSSWKPLSLSLSPLSLRRLRIAAAAAESPSPSPSPSMSASAQPSSTQDPKPFAVLFVCLGNICRSPAAEAVFRDLVRKKGLESNFAIDSAGTIGYHEGNPADSRMRAASMRRGIEVTSISRPLRPSDFRDFDLILAMDMQNRGQTLSFFFFMFKDILSAYERWSFKEAFPADAHKKVKLMCSYCTKHKETEVPDPYYGGPQGFEKVLDLLDDACEALLDNILVENSQLAVS